MKKTTMAAAIALIAASGTATFAGDVSDAGTMDDMIVVLDDTTAGSSASLPLGSLGGSAGIAVPAVLGLLIVGALAASDSSGGSE